MIVIMLSVILYYVYLVILFLSLLPVLVLKLLNHLLCNPGCFYLNLNLVLITKGCDLENNRKRVRTVNGCFIPLRNF